MRRLCPSLSYPLDVVFFSFAGHAMVTSFLGFKGSCSICSYRLSASMGGGEYCHLEQELPPPNNSIYQKGSYSFTTTVQM